MHEYRVLPDLNKGISRVNFEKEELHKIMSWHVFYIIVIDGVHFKISKL